MMATFFKRNQSVILYGFLLAALLFVMKLLEWEFIIARNAFEIYAGIIAALFTLLGIWLALKLTKPKTVVVEKEVLVTPPAGFVLNQTELANRAISKREYEVLQLMAEGLSNQQIAERLFVSVNTIKTHSSNVLFKLEAGRRTQAIEIAKRLNLIP